MVACKFRRAVVYYNQRRCSYEYKRRDLRPADEARPVPGRAGGETFRDPAGGVPLGKRGDRAEYRDAEAAVPALPRFHQHPAGLAPAAHLPVLRHAPGGRDPGPGQGRGAERGLLPVVLCRRELYLQRHGRADRGLRPQSGEPGLLRGAGQGLAAGEPARAGLLEAARGAGGRRAVRGAEKTAGGGD